jgi:single-strand DNA-binding protein
LTRDAVSKTIPSGSKLLEFAVACNTGYGNRAAVTYYDVSLWGKNMDKLKGYLLKGRSVALTGSFEVQEYEYQGETRRKYAINTSSVTLTGGAGDKDEQSHRQKPSLFDEEDNSGDIPF